MDPAPEDVVADGEDADFFDIDSFNLDDFDLDLPPDEFSGAYAAFVAGPRNWSGVRRGWLAGSGVRGSTQASSSPDSGVTDNGPLAGDDEGSFSASYACESLERFLSSENNDAVDDDDVAEEGITVGDLQAAVEDAAGNEEEEESLDAREDEESTSRN